jgi:hypothetical protein
MSLTPPGKGYAHFVLAVEAQDDRKGRRQSGRLPSLHQDGVVVVEHDSKWNGVLLKIFQVIRLKGIWKFALHIVQYINVFGLIFTYMLR